MLSRYLGLFLLLVPCLSLSAQDGADLAVAGQGQLPAEPSADLTPADLYEVGEEAGQRVGTKGLSHVLLQSVLRARRTA